MSTVRTVTRSDFYADLGVDPQSTSTEIAARIAEERERATRLKKIPKHRPEAETRLTNLAEIERVLLDPSARSAYDLSLQTADEPASAPPVVQGPPATQPEEPENGTRFCTGCGAGIPAGASFCEECGVPVGIGPSSPGSDTSEEHKLEHSLEPGDADGDAKASPESDVLQPPDPPPASAQPALFSASQQPRSGGKGLLFLLIPFALLIVIGGGIWFFGRKPQPAPVVVPPVPGQVTDLQPPQVSLLNHPTFQPSPVASWNVQNIQGTVVLKSENELQMFIYPNGSQFTLRPELFKASSVPAVAYKDEYGTVGLDAFYPIGGNPPSVWQVQFQAGQAKDINGDGFPEIVLSDYSGGAHCCTSIAVVSLRPQGPFVVFNEQLGSGAAEFKDIDGDGRREIRHRHLFEYALGTFAQGTFGLPVIYSAAADGVYRVNTRAYTQLLSNEYDTALQDYRKTTYDQQVGAMEEDRDLIDLFFLAYVAGRRTEAFEALSNLKPLTTDLSSNSDPRAILEEALKKVAPEVLQEPEWTLTKSGQPVTPEQPASAPIPGPYSAAPAQTTPQSSYTAPSYSQPSQQQAPSSTPQPVAPVYTAAPAREEAPVNGPSNPQHQAPANTSSSAIATTGYITWTGEVDKKGTITIDGRNASIGKVDGELPGIPVTIDLDTKNYALVEYPNASTGWKRFTIRSKNKKQAIILKWEVVNR